MGFDIKGTFPFIRSNKEDLFRPATTFVFFVVRTTRTSLRTKEHSSSHHSSCPTYAQCVECAYPSRAGCLCYLRLCREERGPVGGCGGAGVPSCEGRMGDEAAGAAKTRNGVGGCLHSGDYDQKCSLMLSGNVSRLEYKFHKGFINGNLNHVAISRYSRPTL